LFFLEPWTLNLEPSSRLTPRDFGRLASGCF
jgi:hypothetical protein